MNIKPISTPTFISVVLCGVLSSSLVSQIAQAQQPSQPGKAQPGKAQPGKAQPGKVQPGKVQPDQVQWQSFSPPKSGFTVLMPGQPTEKIQAVDTAAGKVNTYFYNSSLEGGKVSYTVSYVELPAGLEQLPPQLILEAMASGLTGNGSVKVLSERVVQLGSYPGREFKFESPNQTTVLHRAYLVKQRIYQMAVEVPVPRANALSADVARFMDSFKLL